MRKNCFKRARTANLTNDFKISYNATSIKIVRGVGCHGLVFKPVSCLEPKSTGFGKPVAPDLGMGGKYVPLGRAILIARGMFGFFRR